jgi:hypothetical protein
MAGGASAAGIPGELPVMGALVSSGMQNLNTGDASDAGYFQIRIDIWDQGDYAGFREHPSLQLQWFIDHALAIRQQRIAQGIAQYGQDPSKWGEWVADVERPAAQYRDRYQPRLEEARSLIAAGCAAPAAAEPGPATPPGPDPGSGGQPAPAAPDLQLIPESVLPNLKMTVRKRQDTAGAGGLVATAVCTNESCFVTARGTIAVPGRGLFRVAAPSQKLKRGERGKFKLALGKKVRKLVAGALGRGAFPQAAIRLVAANAGGYRISASRTVVLVGSAR